MRSYLSSVGPNHNMLYAVAHALAHERQAEAMPAVWLRDAAAARRRPHLESAAAVTIRRALVDDERALFDLALLSNDRLLTGEILLIEVDGRIRAACSVSDGRMISDPFRPSESACSLLDLRREHILKARAGTRSLPLRRRLALRLGLH